ncbi:MAG: methyltransferase domain-containing protein, partial [Syntrophales bacterium]|nr:methyltransferase domain-containing protein [Syntrophales bacterium]
GLVYALLHSMGYDIISLEPGADGFGDRHRAGLRLLNILGVDSTGWIKRGVEDFPGGNRDSTFDLIFSYFVLEHLRDIEGAFRVMSLIMKEDGLMIHRCPNYTVPFEPHYNIPLVPFKPEWTSFFFPQLRNKGLWKGLRFTTVRSIRKLCAFYGLQPSFHRGMNAWAFERVLTDPVFRARKQGFITAARVLQTTGLIGVLRGIPVMLDTPMEFTAIKLEHSRSL